LFTTRRNALMALFLAWHASVSLCGPGHHALGELVEHLVCGKEAPSETDEAFASSAHSEEHCQACHFFSEVSESRPVGSSLLCLIATGEIQSVDRACSRQAISRSAAPRAPPRIGA
jgi:hypothetical protein